MVATNDDLLAELQAIKRQLKKLNEKERFKFSEADKATLSAEE